MSNGVELREVIDEDLPTFFEHEIDPVAVEMAAFTASDPTNREVFDTHWRRIRGSSTVIVRTILYEGRVAGHIAQFEREGDPEVTYWIGREFWGKGIATAALSALLNEVTVRPMYARAAADNAASIRVLEKCGFAVFAHERGYANARGETIDEVVMKLE